MTLPSRAGLQPRTHINGVGGREAYVLSHGHAWFSPIASLELWPAGSESCFFFTGLEEPECVDGIM